MNLNNVIVLIALVVVILFIFWLTEGAGKTNFFD